MFYFYGPQIPRFLRTVDKRTAEERKAKCSRVRLREEPRNMDFQPVTLTVFHRYPYPCQGQTLGASHPTLHMLCNLRAI